MRSGTPLCQMYAPTTTWRSRSSWRRCATSPVTRAGYATPLPGSNSTTSRSWSSSGDRCGALPHPPGVRNATPGGVREVDRACHNVQRHRTPWVQCRCGITKDDAEADPDAHATVIWVAAPPCQDFSFVTEGKGHDGERGGLFLHTINVMLAVQQLTAPRRFGFLYENVAMVNYHAQAISDALHVEPVYVCASDFGWVSRPSLWWMSVDWTINDKDPHDDKHLQWTKAGKWNRLRPETTRRSADEFDLQGLQYNEGVASGKLSMPTTATTPAADDNGGKTPPDAHARWLADKRQFALWHYKREAMLADNSHAHA